jgi:Ca-activated chloride channel homolog
MNFANPRMLWLLLVIPPALAAFFWWAGRKRKQLLTQFIQARLLPALTVGISAKRQRIRLGCLVLAVACLILALARPQWGFDWEEIKQKGLDIVVAIDTSKSMLAEDIPPNRLARAKLAALELMQRAKADRLGLVAFAGTAFLQCPLTIDDAAFRQSLETLDVNTIPQGGTALAAAIETALTAYKEGDTYKILVLFTDGEDQDSGAQEAAERAAKEGLRIFTVGIGTAEGDLVRIKNAQGGSDFVRDEEGNVHKSHLNERLLQQIAGATEGGFYLPLRGAKAIDTLYDQGLAKLPKSQHQEKFVRQYHDRYHWPLAVAIVVLLVEILFPERKRVSPAKHAKDTESNQTSGGPSSNRGSMAKSSPRPPSSVLQPQSSLLSLWCVSWLLFSPGQGFASPSSALREYKAGQYDQALKEYERLLQKKTDDPRLHFNAGAAAYRNQQFEEAAKQFNATQKSGDLKLQGLAYYNEGNALYHLGETNPDPKQRTDAWEKALQDYQSTTKLNPQDADAKFNYEFVKRKLEELKQEQQKSQQNKQDQKQNQDQDQQQKDQNQQNQDQQKNQDEQQKQQQAQQNQKQDSSQQDQQAQQKKAEEQKQQQQQAAKQSQEQKQDQQQAQQSSGQPKDKADEKEQEAAAAQAAGQMTPEQAQQLLDTQKGDEQMLPVKPTGKPADRSRPIRDW